MFGCFHSFASYGERVRTLFRFRISTRNCNRVLFLLRESAESLTFQLSVIFSLWIFRLRDEISSIAQLLAIFEVR